MATDRIGRQAGAGMATTVPGSAQTTTVPGSAQTATVPGSAQTAPEAQAPLPQHCVDIVVAYEAEARRAAARLAALAEAPARADRLQADLDTATTQLRKARKGARAKIDTLKQDTHAWRKKAKAARSQSSELRAAHGALEAEADALRSALAEAHEENADLLAQIDDWQGREAAVRARLDAEQDQVAQLQGDHHRTRKLFRIAAAPYAVILSPVIAVVLLARAARRAMRR